MGRRHRWKGRRWMIVVPWSHEYLNGRLYELGTPEHAEANGVATRWSQCRCFPTGRRAFRELERCPPGTTLERVQYRRGGAHRVKNWIKP